MSRKHPGSSFDYATKRQVQFIKRLEKERRDYFKMRGLLAWFKCYLILESLSHHEWLIYLIF